MTELIKALAVTAEILGIDWSEAAAEMVAGELKAYPIANVQYALKRCIGECKGKLTLTDILERIPGGHPGAEEAWSMVSRGMHNEALTVIWTEEMREAYGVALGALENEMASRMAFKESYQRAVAMSRSEGKMPNWSVSQGSDKADRERAILEGMKQGRLSAPYAMKLLPHPEDPQTIQLLQQHFPRLLE